MRPGPWVLSRTDSGRLLRHSPAFRCQVCGGYATLPHHQGVRCAGYTIDRFVFCTREEHAGAAPLSLTASPPAYRHLRFGPCPCGSTHSPSLWRPHHAFEFDYATAHDLPAASLEDQHEVYSFALGQLSLRDDAIADLTRRGLTLPDVLATGYRSVPATLHERRRFLRAMVDRFGTPRLLATPGFSDKNGRLSFWHGEKFVVPYLDQDHAITGLQARNLAADSGPKYLTARKATVANIHHLAGPIAAGCDLLITEGGLKAEVAARLGNIALFGIPGQSLAVRHIAAIRKLKPRRVIIALDEEDNPTTQQARERWAKLLTRAGFKVWEAVWEGSDLGGPKGIDDLFQAGGWPRLRPVVLAPAGITERRLPQPTTSRGPVTPGVSLAEGRAKTQRVIGAFLRDRRHQGRAPSLVVQSSPGAGKTFAVHASLHPYASARIVVGTTPLAAELAEAFGYGLVRGRNSENCERIDVVRSLADNGHDVARLACGTVDEPRCPVRASCPYWAQFDQGGPLVGATEQLFNPSFLRGASVAIVDDGDLPRAMFEAQEVTLSALERAKTQLGKRANKAVKQLIVLLAYAIIDAPAEPLFGPALWDLLTRTAVRNGMDLPGLIQALPAKPTLPKPDANGPPVLTVDAVERVPPATLRQVLAALTEELPRFTQGGPFNSRLRIRWDADRKDRIIEVQRLREGPVDQFGKRLLDEIPLLILDATPIRPLVDHLTRNHARQPDVRVGIALPSNVHITQYADRTNAYSTLADDERVAEVLANVQREQAAHPVPLGKEAAIVYRRLKEQFVAAGFPPSRVLTYGSARGSNMLADVERLHVVGRPMPPPAELVYQAQVIHHDGPAVSAQLELLPVPYGGQHYQIDVVDFLDPRVSTLLHARREDELLQVLHRARITDLAAQQRLDGESTGRRQVEIFIHTSHPIPGLRVDHLRIDSPDETLNESRATDARERILRACAELAADGEEPTVTAITERAHASRTTVGKVLAASGETRNGEGVHTSPVSLSNGVYTLPKTEPATPPPSPPRSRASAGSAPPAPLPSMSATAAVLASLDAHPDPDSWVPCPGDCGTLVHPSGMCRPCTEDALAAWRAAGKPRGRPPP